MKPSETCVGTRSANRTPAAPASAEPSTNVNTITRSMSIPIIAAASRSNEVARIALPVRVLLTRNQSTIISANAETMMMIADERDLDVADREALQEERVPGSVEQVVVAVLRAEQQLHRVREEERDAERADQRGDPRRVAQRPVGEALDHDAEHRAACHRGERDDERAAAQIGTTGSVEPPSSWSIPKPMNEPDHDDVAVGEVEELEDAVDERVAERDQRVDAAERQPVDGERDELLVAALARSRVAILSDACGPH